MPLCGYHHKKVHEILKSNRWLAIKTKSIIKRLRSGKGFHKKKRGKKKKLKKAKINLPVLKWKQEMIKPKDQRYTFVFNPVPRAEMDDMLARLIK